MMMVVTVSRRKFEPVGGRARWLGILAVECDHLGLLLHGLPLPIRGHSGLQQQEEHRSNLAIDEGRRRQGDEGRHLEVRAEEAPTTTSAAFKLNH
jgi:hypothetical protein